MRIRATLPNLDDVKLMILSGSLALLALTPCSAQSDVDLRFLQPFDSHASWAPSPNFDLRPHDTVVDTIVLHHTACTLDETIRHFAKPHTKVSAHFTIGRNGELVQHASSLTRAWHAGPSLDPDGREKVNDFSIGIELVHNGQSWEDYPQAQLDTLIDLIQRLRDQAPIRRIVSHRLVAQPPGRKTDPIAFPWSSLEGLGVELCP